MFKIKKAQILQFMCVPGTTWNIQFNQNNFQNWPELIEKYGCNMLIIYNPRLFELITLKDFTKYDLKKITLIVCGGSYISPDMYHKIRKEFQKHSGFKVKNLCLILLSDKYINTFNAANFYMILIISIKFFLNS